jgi:hypothetical protein
MAYNSTGGSIGDIMTYIPHSTHDDESRFITIISDLITKGELSSLPTWESSIKDEKSKLVRKKQGEKEAKEAEKLAKELGVWDEFYGTGKTGQRKSKANGKGKGQNRNDEGEGEDHSALQALILKKRQKNMDGFFDSLAAKYAEPESSGKSKGKGTKRRKVADEDEESPKKSRRGGRDTPEINDKEFEKLQEKLFGDKESSRASNSADITDSKGKKGKGRKAK